MSADELDDYEIMCQKNIAERNAFMKSFFTDIKKDTQEIQDLEKQRKKLKERKRKSNSESPITKIKDYVTRYSENKKIKKDSFIVEAKKFSNLHSKIEKGRYKIARSILNFDFDANRLKALKTTYRSTTVSKGVVYWMFRDVRVQDNWALLFAQKIALLKEIPLHVCFCLVPEYSNSSIRHYEFLLEGLKEVENDLKNLDINFHLLLGEPTNLLVDFINKYQIGTLICDFLPLRLHLSWVEEIKEKLPKSCSYFQVDAHNVIPCWNISDKLQITNVSIMHKIQSHLEEFLTEYPPVIKHPYKADFKFKRLKNDWKSVVDFIQADKTVKKINLVGGTKPAIMELEKFIKNDLESYFEQRNNFINDTMANLKPWLNYGMISVQRCILELNEFKKFYEKSVKIYIDEVLLHKSRCDHFCFHNPNYDNLKAARKWVLDSINENRSGDKKHIYTLSEFENAETHEDLWNAAQIQLKQDGIMHSYLALYWAKKILKWTENTNDAIEYAIYLINKYSIEGQDPTGYIGCMSICGVYNTCRFLSKKTYMKNYDLASYIEKYSKKIE